MSWVERIRTLLELKVSVRKLYKKTNSILKHAPIKKGNV